MSSELSIISLRSLNPQQKEVVTYPLKPLLVVAGAGTGKTTVLVKRFEYLVKEKNIPPEEIMLVTFTNKAATEIKKKIYLLFNKDEEFLQRVKASTFHKFCKNILESEGRQFNVCYESKAVEYIKDSISRLGFSIKSNWEIADIIWKIKWFQHVEKKEITEEDLMRAGRHCTKLSDEQIKSKYPFEDFKSVLQEYETSLKRGRLLFFDDIQFEVDKLLDDETKRARWEERIKAILFDEFQDIDPVQLSIITKLSKGKGNIFCVGDPDQAIYGFRNAVPEAFQEFERRLGNVEIKKLEINYRSTHQILKVANVLMNREKTFFSKNLVSAFVDNVGEPVRLFITNDHVREVQEIISTITSIRDEKKVPLRKFAVLFRNWSFGRKLSELLVENGIPYFSEDLKNIWNKEEIKDALAYLNLAFEKDMGVANKSLMRIINKPSRGFGPKTLQNLKNQANRLGIPLLALIKKKSDKDPKCANLWSIISDIRKLTRGKDSLSIQMSNILKTSGLMGYFEKNDNQRLFNIQTFLNFITELNLSNFDQALEKLKELTRFTTDRDAVYLSTVHSAKGLEFDYVFVMHLEEGNLPSSLSFNKPEEIEEERRIVYVAITRCKKRLFLSCSAGQEKMSRFVKDIEDLLSKTIDLSKSRVDNSYEDDLSFSDVNTYDDLEDDVALSDDIFYEGD